MKKVALVFVTAVIVPSLVLAWLAARSLRDQQFLLERQQSLLYQDTADSFAKDMLGVLDDAEREFTSKVTTLLNEHTAFDAAKSFDDLLRQVWPLAEVGFVVSASGEILCPSPVGRPEARTFCADNSRFLANRESAEVYLSTKQASNSLNPAQAAQPSKSRQTDGQAEPDRKLMANAKQEMRSVVPQLQNAYAQKGAPAEDNQVSKVTVSEAEFRQLIGDQRDGMLARFVDNKLKVLFWCRAPSEPQMIFGTQLALSRLKPAFDQVLQRVEPALGEQICLALLDDTARPVARSRMGFEANWKHPFVATEIGEALPHWEVAVYLLNPARLAQSAQTLEWTLGLLVALLVLAIGIGSWLIVTDLSRQLTLARQKTDFVSNVSHELKTPLTSIRMFSELLSEGRVSDPAKQRSYLGIITAEAARLTRLINNVLDFSRIERGEKKYQFQPCDIVALAQETAEMYRPHLEANGFRFDCEIPGSKISVKGDRDALAQVIVNLLSNAEKYSSNSKEILLRIQQNQAPLPHVEVSVLDRGLGVPKGCEEKIFEKFYRAHDSLSSGIQGSGLGLTLARQIARAHGGEVVYQAREGGGSCFSLRLPAQIEHASPPDQ
jgi:signal transduction histidine kinase